MSRLLLSKLPRPIPSIPFSTLISVLVTVIAVAILYLGREVLVPIALALLLSFALAPLVRLLQAWYFPRIVAVFDSCVFRILYDLWVGRFHGFAGHPACGQFACISVHVAGKDSRPPGSSRRRRAAGTRLGCVEGPEQGDRETRAWFRRAVAHRPRASEPANSGRGQTTRSWCAPGPRQDSSRLSSIH